MKLILGTVQMGLNYGVNNPSGKISTRDAIDILEYAYDNGIRLLDTAEVYGNAHEVIGAYHRAHPLYKFGIVTKIPAGIQNVDVKSRVEEYLDDLYVDRIELLMYHNFDAFLNHGIIHCNIEEIKSLGLISKMGVSLYTNSQIETLLLCENPIDTIQLPYNLLDNYYQRGEIMKKIRSAGISIHTRSPFLQGLLFMDKESEESVYRSLRPYIAELEIIANDAELTLYELALQYSYYNNLSDAVITGVDSLNQLRLNLSAVSQKLIDTEIERRINNIAVSNVDHLNPSLWKK